MTSFNEVCIDVTKTARKIPQSDYLVNGKYKIFDQGKDYIGGYTDDDTGIVEEYPYIVFGDHTRIIKFVNEPCFIGADGVKLLKVYNLQFLPKYVYYSLVANPIVSIGYSRHFKYLKEQSIRDCSIDEQKRIITELENHEKAISIKKESLSSLDELVKSRFIEMFIGKGFERCKIKYLVDRKITTSKKGHLPTDLIKYIDISSIDNQKNEVVSYTEYKLLDAPSRAQQCLMENDILVSTVRPNLKNIAINRYNDNNIVGSSGFCVLRSTLCNPLYLLHCILTDDFTTQMTSLTSGASYPAIRDNDVIDYEVINPPIELQNEFAEFVKLIDKSKFVCHSKNFLCDIFTFSSSTIAYPSVVSIFVCPKRC